LKLERVLPIVNDDEDAGHCLQKFEHCVPRKQAYR
jgi:hypothetical protein